MLTRRAGCGGRCGHWEVNCSGERITCRATCNTRPTHLGSVLNGSCPVCWTDRWVLAARNAISEQNNGRAQWGIHSCRPAIAHPLVRLFPRPRRWRRRIRSSPPGTSCRRMRATHGGRALPPQLAVPRCGPGRRTARQATGWSVHVRSDPARYNRCGQPRTPRRG